MHFVVQQQPAVQVQPTVQVQPAVQLQPVQQQPGTINSIVVTGQPNAPKHRRDWNTGLCQCFDDCNTCMFGACCCPILAMQTASDLDETLCIVCFVPASTVAMRVKLRTQENIGGSICGDCMVSYCCMPCATCQLAREVKIVKSGPNQRGY